MKFAFGITFISYQNDPRRSAKIQIFRTGCQFCNYSICLIDDCLVPDPLNHIILCHQSCRPNNEFLRRFYTCLYLPKLFSVLCFTFFARGM